jgi:predicted acylesterase/phospholipase RssA
MSSYGMLHRVALVRTDGSEELITSINAATRIGELGTTLAVVASNRSTLEAVLSSETSVLTRITRQHIPRDGILHSVCHEHLKS